MQHAAADAADDSAQKETAAADSAKSAAEKQAQKSDTETATDAPKPAKDSAAATSEEATAVKPVDSLPTTELPSAADAPTANEGSPPADSDDKSNVVIPQEAMASVEQVANAPLSSAALVFVPGAAVFDGPAVDAPAEEQSAVKQPAADSATDSTSNNGEQANGVDGSHKADADANGHAVAKAADKVIKQVCLWAV